MTGLDAWCITYVKTENPCRRMVCDGVELVSMMNNIYAVKTLLLCYAGWQSFYFFVFVCRMTVGFGQARVHSTTSFLLMKHYLHSVDRKATITNGLEVNWESIRHCFCGDSWFHQHCSIRLQCCDMTRVQHVPNAQILLGVDMYTVSQKNA